MTFFKKKFILLFFVLIKVNFCTSKLLLSANMLETVLIVLNRWALYPPGKVPIGVTVHVSDEDGDVHIDTPSSLQVILQI